ncbi:MAG: DHHW family protein, partial [Oscillospiraceae bacterium]|nr:DHHW family protein [Oscillospiraceae bacterium]
MKQNNSTEKESVKPVLPFFLVLALISLISAIIPLRPTVSYEEKRELAKFPEFSPEAFVSGSYFKEIDLWFSDTFPGREQWLQLSQSLSSLHGYGDLAIEGQLPDMEEIPEIPAPTKSADTDAVEEETLPPEDTLPSEEPLSEETEEPALSDDAQKDTGDDVLLDATFSSTSVVQFNGS